MGAPAWLMFAALAWLVPTSAGDDWPRPAQAAETAASETIRAGIEHYFADFMHPAVRHTGGVTVSDRDGAFDIVIPGVAIDRRKGGTFDVGDITARAHPLANGHFRVTAALPETMGFRDENDVVVTFVVIGRQRFEGVWAPEDEIFVQLDAALEDIWVNELGSPPGVTIGTLAIKGAAVETSPGSWNSPSMIRIDDIRIGAEDGSGTLTVGAIEIRSFGDGMKLDAQRLFSRQIAEELNQGSEDGDAANADPLAILRALDTLPRLFTDLSTEITISDVAYRDAEGVRTFGLGRMFQRFTMNDLDKERSRIDFRYEHSGLDVAAGNGVPAELVPSEIVVDMVASRLPNALLWRALSDWIKASTTSTTEFAQAVLADRLSAAVLEAASELQIRRLAVESPNFAIESNGVFRADVNALFNVTAEFDIAVRGMDRLVAAVSAAAADDREARNLAAVLALFQALGAIETDETGASVRRYRIEVPADGALMLNGNDIAGILGVMGSRNP